MICILFDSQAALKAWRLYGIINLVWEWLQNLIVLAERNKDNLVWVPVPEI